VLVGLLFLTQGNLHVLALGFLSIGLFASIKWSVLLLLGPCTFFLILGTFERFISELGNIEEASKTSKDTKDAKESSTQDGHDKVL
jgi:hypothetical protein